MYCDNCGHFLKDGTAYCPYCGEKQTRTIYVRGGVQPMRQPQNVPSKAIPEKTLCTCRRHWSAYLWAGFFAFIFAIAAIFLLFSGNFLAFLFYSVITAIIVVCSKLSYESYYLELTNQKLIGHKGIINSITMSTPLAKIENVAIGNDLSGKIFDYHTIIVDNAGNSNIRYIFTKMADAQQFVENVNKFITRK